MCVGYVYGVCVCVEGVCGMCVCTFMCLYNEELCKLSLLLDMFKMFDLYVYVIS